MLMTLGLFPFSIQTAPYEELKRATRQRWEGKNRVRQGPAYQWLGPGDDEIAIEGSLVPGLTGGTAMLDKLRAMADEGKAWLLTAGTGDVLGRWIILEVNETRRHMLSNGAARLIPFSLTLRRYWDDDQDQWGNLMDSRP